MFKEVIRFSRLAFTRFSIPEYVCTTNQSPILDRSASRNSSSGSPGASSSTGAPSSAAGTVSESAAASSATVAASSSSTSIWGTSPGTSPGTSVGSASVEGVASSCSSYGCDTVTQSPSSGSLGSLLRLQAEPAGVSRLAEDLEDQPTEGQVEQRDDRHQHQHEHQHDQEVGDQLPLCGPDDLAELGHDLPVEGGRTGPRRADGAALRHDSSNFLARSYRVCRARGT